MSIFKKYGTDKELCEEGAWIDLHENEDGSMCSFKLGRFNGDTNKNLMKVQERHSKKATLNNRNKKLTNKQNEEIATETFLDAILLDWKNLQKEDGTVIKYSRKAAEDLLEKIPELHTELLQLSRERAFFQKEQLEEDLGN